MGDAAVEAARAVGYRNAGTVEFLFDPQTREFYFLEMNTRLQVEHPVTEMVTGLDLVSLQLDIAEGKPLPIAQEDVALKGVAIEARLYAEDPSTGFTPQSGALALFTAPRAARIDSGVETGDRVSAFYDPMIAKVIVHADTRAAACDRLSAALEEIAVLGVVTNRDFLIALLSDETFRAGAAATDYVEANLDRLATRKPAGGSAALALAAAAMVDWPFDDLLTGWCSRADAGFPLKLGTPNGSTIRGFARLDGRRFLVTTGEGEAAIEIFSKSESEILYRHDGRLLRARYTRAGAVLDIDAGGAASRYIDMALAPAAENGVGADVIKAPMTGAVTSVTVRPGDKIAKGATVATVEAMKMEHHLKAARDGVVSEVHVKPGDQVAIRAKVVSLKPEQAL
jgi:geranyl-CoA carboxylase alpha subunit